MIQWDKITKSNKLPTEMKAVENFSEVGKETHRRMLLEAERRFATNDSEVVNGTEPVSTEREDTAVLFDPRLVVSCEGMSFARRCLIVAITRQRYVQFGLRYEEYNAAKAASASSHVATATTEQQQVSKKRKAERTVVDCWGDSSDEEDDFITATHSESVLSPEEVLANRTEELGAEFDTVFKRWRAACKSLDWAGLFPHLLEGKEEGDAKLDLIHDLLTIDLGVIFKKFIKEDTDRKKYGYLPIMATHSFSSVGSLCTSSFVERCNSAANLILTDGNTLLSPEEINMLTVLRINKPFMDFCRKNYTNEIKEMGVNEVTVTEAMNEENGTASTPPSDEIADAEALIAANLADLEAEVE